MPSFETPPEWWVSLANLTKWLYWPAWAAIFSLLALLNTARLADRSARQDRRKDALLLWVGGQLLDIGVTPFESWLEDADRGPLTYERTEVVLIFYKREKLYEAVEDFDSEKLPSVVSYRCFHAGRVILAQLKNQFEYPDGTTCYPNMEEVSKLIDSLQEMAKSLQRASDVMISKRERRLLHDWGVNPPVLTRIRSYIEKLLRQVAQFR